MKDLAEEVLTRAQQEAQKAFDEIAKPILLKRMKALKVREIEHAMGVDFYTMENGECYSSTAFSQLSEAKQKFVDDFRAFQDGPLYYLINTDLKRD